MITDPFLQKKWNLKAKHLYQDGRIVAEFGDLVEEPCVVSWCTHPLRAIQWKTGESDTICMGNLQERPDGEYDLVDGVGE